MGGKLPGKTLQVLTGHGEGGVGWERQSGGIATNDGGSWQPDKGEGKERERQKGGVLGQSDIR